MIDGWMDGWMDGWIDGWMRKHKILVMSGRWHVALCCQGFLRKVHF